MANWAFTSYAIEGPVDILRKIYNVILHHPVQEGSSPRWEGNICTALDAKWDEKKSYLRGFISGEPKFTEDCVLRFDAEEAWGVTDFNEILENKFPDIKVYWVTEEMDCEVYQTNDADGKYFKDKYYVDTCINGNYQAEYFRSKEAVFKWLWKITKGKVCTEEDVKNYNESVVLDERYNKDDFISIHSFNIIKKTRT